MTGVQACALPIYPGKLLSGENILSDLVDDCKGSADVVRVSNTPGMEVFSDIMTQKFFAIMD